MAVANPISRHFGQDERPTRCVEQIGGAQPKRRRCCHVVIRSATIRTRNVGRRVQPPSQSHQRNVSASSLLKIVGWANSPLAQLLYREFKKRLAAGAGVVKRPLPRPEVEKDDKAKGACGVGAPVWRSHSTGVRGLKNYDRHFWRS